MQPLKGMIPKAFFMAMMVWLTLCLAVPARATLIDRGPFNDGLGG